MHRVFSFLHSPHTPALIRAATPIAVDLVLRTTKVGTEERFTQLCKLLGDGIIGSVWIYGYQDPQAIEASVEVLPVLVTALGLGTVRYLKVWDLYQITLNYLHERYVLQGSNTATDPSTPTESVQAFSRISTDCLA